jgi:hypothetical protein
MLLSGCVAFIGDESDMPVGIPEHGCTIVVDPYGEREVCDVDYYVVDGGVVYFDPYYRVWIGPRGYWYGGRYVVGYWGGYHAYYRGYYRTHGGYVPRGGGSRWHTVPNGGYRGGWHRR